MDIDLHVVVLKAVQDTARGVRTNRLLLFSEMIMDA